VYFVPPEAEKEEGAAGAAATAPLPNPNLEPVKIGAIIYQTPTLPCLNPPFFVT